MVRKYVLAAIVFVLFIPFSIGYGVEQPNSLQKITEISSLDDKYSNLLLFIESYNANAQTPIQSTRALGKVLSAAKRMRSPAAAGFFSTNLFFYPNRLIPPSSALSSAAKAYKILSAT